MMGVGSISPIRARPCPRFKTKTRWDEVGPRNGIGCSAIRYLETHDLRYPIVDRVGKRGARGPVEDARGR